MGVKGAREKVPFDVLTILGCDTTLLIIEFQNVVAIDTGTGRCAGRRRSVHHGLLLGSLLGFHNLFSRGHVLSLPFFENFI